jgi:hypothetical protein
MRQQALAGLAAQGHGPYSQPFRDIYDARAQQAAVDLEREAVRLNNAHLANTQNAQSQMALQGGQLMATGQQNRNNLLTQQRGMALDYANSLLGGVNGVLAGLFK